MTLTIREKVEKMAKDMLDGMPRSPPGPRPLDPFVACPNPGCGGVMRDDAGKWICWTCGSHFASKPL